MKEWKERLHKGLGTIVIFLRKWDHNARKISRTIFCSNQLYSTCVSKIGSIIVLGLLPTNLINDDVGTLLNFLKRENNGARKIVRGYRKTYCRLDTNG